MKRTWILAFVFLLPLLLSSCKTATLKVTELNEPLITESGEEIFAYAEAENYSWLLFNCIPIFSGNADRPNSGSYSMLQRNKATKRYTERMLRNLPQKKQKFELVELKTVESSTGYPTLFLLWFNHVRSTAFLKSNKDK